MWRYHCSTNPLPSNQPKLTQFFLSSPFSLVVLKHICRIHWNATHWNRKELPEQSRRSLLARTSFNNLTQGSALTLDTKDGVLFRVLQLWSNSGTCVRCYLPSTVFLSHRDSNRRELYSFVLSIPPRLQVTERFCKHSKTIAVTFTTTIRHFLNQKLQFCS